MSHYVPLGSISDPCLPSSALHGPYCVSSDYTLLAKFALEKQTSQQSLVVVLWMGSVWVQPLAEPKKWNRPRVTFRSVSKIIHISNQHNIMHCVVVKSPSYIHSSYICTTEQYYSRIATLRMKQENLEEHGEIYLYLR